MAVFLRDILNNELLDGNTPGLCMYRLPLESLVENFLSLHDMMN